LLCFVVQENLAGCDCSKLLLWELPMFFSKRGMRVHTVGVQWEKEQEKGKKREKI